MVTRNERLGIKLEKCTGCAACMNGCPVAAIQMKENQEGFLMPYIDQEKCIDCSVCDKICPIITPKVNENQLLQIYAACAKDEIRMNSSSGGIFTILSNAILEDGGVVCGASYTKDFLGVEHILIEKPEEVISLQGSKYVQSSINRSYQKVKKILEENRKVLFSGTPCQVAGLKHYLGKEYHNLFTVDLICHGVPSPKAYRRFIKYSLETAGNLDSKIAEVNFRKKSEWGWNPSIYIRLENGFVYSKSRSQTCWYNSFLNILNCRKSCGDCYFNKIPRIGEITLGDFWGLPEEENDGKGTSIAVINNEKGKELFNSIFNQLNSVKEIDLETAQVKNGNLVGSSRSHKYRKRFFDLLDKYSDYEKVTEYALKRKFDIGFVGWWYGKNYGSVLTNYALSKYLESLGYSVLMLEWPEKKKPVEPVEDSFSRRFAKKHYEISIRRTYDELYDLNWFCDIFVVGSDQLWNYWSTKENGSFFFLNFVDDSKKKIAYATSFGHPQYGAPWHILKKNAFHLNRFDFISVREQDGIEICRDSFGVDAVCTIDPVFLCKESIYRKLVEEAKAEEKEKFIFAYILSPTLEKREMIEKISEEQKLKVILVLDAQDNHEKNKEIINMPEALRENLELEDWLYYVLNSQLVLTDSYHGVCFSIIFRKNFICIANIVRGLSRFQTLLGLTGLEENMFFNPIDVLESKKYKEKIDYDMVWNKLEIKIIQSKSWLINALKASKACRASGYDLLIEKINELEKQIEELNRRLEDKS